MMEEYLSLSFSELRLRLKRVKPLKLRVSSFELLVYNVLNFTVLWVCPLFVSSLHLNKKIPLMPSVYITNRCPYERQYR